MLIRAKVVKVISVPPDRLILHLRDENKGRRVVEVIGFKPHFYVPDPAGDFRSLFGERLRKIEVPNFKIVPSERAKYPRHFQADIPYTRNFLICTGVRSGVVLPDREVITPGEIKPADDVRVPTRRCFIDIEVAGPGALDVISTPAPVVAFSAWDSYTSEYTTMVVGHSSCSIEGVRLYRGEKELLTAIDRYLKAIDPDVLVVWNAEYDIPYLTNRGAKLGVDFTFPEVFDLKAADRKLHRRLSHSLKDVAVEEGFVDQEHVVDVMTALERYQRGDVRFLAEYNRNDVKYMVQLDEKYRIVDFFESLKEYAGVVHYSDTLKFSVLVDTMLLRRAKEMGVVLPSAPEEPEEHEKYLGALVSFFTDSDSRVGLFENVAVFDLSRAYPSLIRTLNISPEVSGPQDRPGIMPTLVKELFTERDKIEAKLNQLTPGASDYKALERKRDVVKFITNACMIPGTEILTPTGLKRIEEFRVGDIVYTLNPENFSVELSRVVDTQVFDFDGRLYQIGGKHGSSFFLVTPEHRFFLAPKKGKKISNFRWLEARELRPGYCYCYPKHKPIEGKIQEYFYLSDNIQEAEVGIFSSLHGRALKKLLMQYGVPVDCLRHAYIGVNGRWGSISGGIRRKAGRFQKLPWRQKIVSIYVGPLSKLRPYLDIISKFGQVKIRENRRRTLWLPYKFRMDDWLEFLGWYVTEGFLRHNEAKLPRGLWRSVVLSQKNPYGRNEIKNLLHRMGLTYRTNKERFVITSALLFDLLKEKCGSRAYNKHLYPEVFELHHKHLIHLYKAMMFGDGSLKYGFYRTVSRRLAEDFVRLLFHLGYVPRYKYHRKEGIYEIRATKENKAARYIMFSGNKIKRPKYRGKVYCITTEKNHIIFGGLNGTLNFIGQCYGYTGAAFTRLYDRTKAAQVTKACREVLMHIADFVRRNGFEPLYADTDSVAIQMPFEKTKEFEQKLNEEIERYFREKYGVHECDVRMGLNYYVKKILFTGAKKRYAAHVVWQRKPCDYLRIVGFEAIRTDQSKFTQEVQRTLFDLILRGTREQVIAFVRKALEDFRKQPLERIAFRKGIEKPLEQYGKDGVGIPAHIRGAMYSNRVFGTAFGAGSKPLYLYVKGIIGKPPTDIVAFDGKAPPGIIVDWARMEELTLRGKISSILEAAGISWEEIENKVRGEQRSLMDFLRPSAAPRARGDEVGD
jgi:DNA polymerase I